MFLNNLFVLLKNLFSRFFPTNPHPAANIVDNVNLTDVQHFSGFAKDWWDLNGPFGVLHTLNMVRVPLIRDGLISTGAVKGDKVNKTNILQGVKVLEVGCGAGILTEALGNLKAHVTALDPSETLLSTAQEHFKDRKDFNVEYVCDNIENHAKHNQQKYDAVVASEVLEHVIDQKSFLKSCVDSLKPGGSIFITTLNRTTLSWLGGIIVAEYVLKLLPRNTHDWNLFISPEEVEKILKDLNCSTVLVQGWWYNYFGNTFWWSRYTGITYGLHAVKNDN